MFDERVTLDFNGVGGNAASNSLWMREWGGYFFLRLNNSFNTFYTIGKV